MKNLNIKKFIANFLTIAILLTVLSTFASANTTIADITDESVNANFLTNSNPNIYRLGRKQSHSFEYRFYAGKDVEIAVEGDGSTDLDLYVYAEGKLIAKRDGNSDYETMNLEIYRTTYFTVKVVNRGFYSNDYKLSVYSY